jgi:hypothetical protein
MRPLRAAGGMLQVTLHTEALRWQKQDLLGYGHGMELLGLRKKPEGAAI